MRIEELEIQHTNGTMNYPCWFSNTCDVSETGPDQLTTRVKNPCVRGYRLHLSYACFGSYSLFIHPGDCVTRDAPKA